MAESHHGGVPPAPSARPAALLVVRITAADVGSRVSVRHRFEGSTLTDTLGVLLSWTADKQHAERGGGDNIRGGLLRIEKRDGSVVEVLERDVVAAKVVPPAPPRRPR